jgi:sporulation protein YlmC with PRC-barrel domain
MTRKLKNLGTCVATIGAVLLASVAAEAHHEAFRAKTLIGQALHDKTGAVVGHVEDLIINADDTTVMSAVVEIGGVLGVGGKLVAVPGKAIEFLHEDSEWHVGLSKQQLEALPAFDPKSVGEMIDKPAGK